MTYTREWVGVSQRSGYVVRVVMRPELRSTPDELITHDCLLLLHVAAGEPVRMMVPDGIAGVVLVLCTDPKRTEHVIMPMTLSRLPDFQ